MTDIKEKYDLIIKYREQLKELKQQYRNGELESYKYEHMVIQIARKIGKLLNEEEG